MTSGVLKSINAWVSLIENGIIGLKYSWVLRVLNGPQVISRCSQGSFFRLVMITLDKILGGFHEYIEYSKHVEHFYGCPHTSKSVFINEYQL